MSQFDFLKAEWPAVHDAATRSATSAQADPRAACFNARGARELAVAWAFKHGPGLRLLKAAAPPRLYEPPYTNLHPSGIHGVFGQNEVDEMLAVLESVRSRAVA
jgi:type I restriction enzyme R subunit